MSIKQTLNEIEDLFSIFDDPKDKFSQLMDIAKESNGIPESDRSNKYKVSGCTSQAWVVCEKQGDKYFFKCDSDALIVKGLLSLLCKIYSGHKSKDIQSDTKEVNEKELFEQFKQFLLFQKQLDKK